VNVNLEHVLVAEQRTEGAEAQDLVACIADHAFEVDLRADLTAGPEAASSFANRAVDAIGEGTGGVFAVGQREHVGRLLETLYEHGGGDALSGNLYGFG
jgi:hypothetical protein